MTCSAAASRARKRVVILKCYSTVFRVPFYEQLRKRLETADVELTIISGQPSKYEQGINAARSDGELSIRNWYFYFGQTYVVWQPALAQCLKADLVIVQQGSRNLINYALIVLRKIFRFRLAFWGHGKNFQAERAKPFSEWVKGIVSTHVDHWFAYNDCSAKVVQRLGFSAGKITSVNNAVDTKENQRLLGGISAEEKQSFRVHYGIAEGAPVGIFCSRLYKDKRLEFLLAALLRIRQEVPAFHFFVIGDGSEAAVVREFERQHGEWFHWLGALYGREQAKVFSVADLHLLPGAVGLNVVDCFAYLIPLVTVKLDMHGPEMAYMENGVNGVLMENNVAEFSQKVVDLLRDRGEIEKLKVGCAKAREIYTIENMVERFAVGVLSVLCD